jgi:phosphatidylglycerol lysyltransferase
MDQALQGTPEQVPATATEAPSRLKGRWPVLLVGTVVLLNGIMELLKAVLVRFRDNPRLFDLPLPFGLYHFSRTLTLVLGFLFFYLALHLYQRRRTAWWVACFALIPAFLAHLGHGHHLYLAAVQLVLFGILFGFRREFTVRSEPRNITQGALLMAASLLLALVFGTLGFWLLDKREFGIEFQWGDSLVRALRQYLLIGNSDLVPQTGHARWFFDALGTVGITSVAFAAYSLFRPLAFRLRTLPHERAQAEVLLGQYARSPEHYFVLEPDKSYFFSPGTTGFIAYRVSAGVALALADPVAPAEAIPKLLRDFTAYCTDNGWKTAFLYAQPGFLPIYEQHGLRALKIGADAIVDLDRFCTTTRTGKHFRKVKRRLEEDGCRVERSVPPHPSALLEQVESVSRAWLSLPGRRERSFALGAFSREYVNRTPLVVMQDPERQAIAFVNEVPAYRPGLATIDLMRHRPDAPYGAMDYLFAELFCLLKESGFKTFDLGLAPLAGVGAGPGASSEERVIRQIYELVSRYLSFEGLRAYKAKFEPDWEDRYLAYSGGPTGLLRIGVAMSRILS